MSGIFQHQAWGWGGRKEAVDHSATVLSAVSGLVGQFVSPPLLPKGQGVTGAVIVFQGSDCPQSLAGFVSSSGNPTRTSHQRHNFLMKWRVCT